MDRLPRRRRWCWILRDVRPFRDPCPCRGAQGLWDWDLPAELLADRDFVLSR